ncbi:MAG: 50S ribosomal protein L16 [Candidatus Anstonellales archaeon]
MGLRPARTCRSIKKVAWTRYSKSTPKKSYIKAMPHLSLHVYKMGKDSDSYNIQYDFVAKQPVQLRDNAIEASRQAVNKYLEKVMRDQYLFHVLVFPHQVLRENKMIAGAGADRLQKGMRMAFGRTTDRAARLYPGQSLFRIMTTKDKEDAVLEAFRRARCKVSGKFVVEKRPISA